MNFKNLISFSVLVSLDSEVKFIKFCYIKSTFASLKRRLFYDLLQ